MGVTSAKQAVVAQLKEQLESAKGVVLTSYKGLTVAQDTELRRELREAGVSYHVVKNTMLRIAAKEAGIEGIEEHLEGTTAFAFSTEDAVAPAKVICGFIKKNKLEDAEVLTVKVGMVDANLEDLKKAVLEDGIELGLAFDGDGDRLGVVTKSGEIIYPDRQMMLFAKDILAHHPGAQIVYDVKCTRRLVPWIEACGGVPTISCTGHSLVKAKLRETGAPFAGEMSGHLFFNDGRWPGFDDGVYAGARILEILSREADPSAALEALPSAVNTPELQVRMAEGENKAFIARLQKEARFDDALDVITIDGVRVEWNDGFALARSSNTTPVVVLRLEGDTPEALERIKKTFAEVLLKVEPSLELPF